MHGAICGSCFVVGVGLFDVVAFLCVFETGRRAYPSWSSVFGDPVCLWLSAGCLSSAGQAKRPISKYSSPVVSSILSSESVSMKKGSVTGLGSA